MGEEHSDLKTENEVTVSIDCIVEHLRWERTDVKVPVGFGKGGAPNKQYQYSGDHYKTIFKVQSDTPVKLLTCRGIPPFSAGDSIRAQIVRGDLKQGYKPGYKPRDFNPEEHTSKIEKIVDGKPVAEYRSS